jgi:hypothetical protein
VGNKDENANRNLERLLAYSRHLRKNDHAVDKMVNSISEYGFRIPVLALSSGEVVDATFGSKQGVLTRCG